MTSIRLSVLGPVSATRDGAEINLGPRQHRLVLALLMARAGRPVSTSALVDLLWEHAPPRNAANIVQRAVGALRRALEPDLEPRSPGRWLHRHADGYRLVAEAATLDLLAFRALVARARDLAAADAVAPYLEALELWHGAPAAGLDPVVRTHPAFTALENEYAEVARAAARVALESGQAQEATAALRRAAERSPWDEALLAELVQVLAAAGRQAEAVAVYHDAVRRLDDEFGVRPGPVLRSAYDVLLRQEITAPSRTVKRPAQLPGSLPQFTGRTDVLQWARDLADQPGPVILALDGMPGIGKTTLAVHLAHELRDRFPDGQLHVDLRGFGEQGFGEQGTAADPAGVLRDFLGAVGVADGDIPESLAARAGLFRGLLLDRRVLILLDNARDLEQIRPLLPSSPGSLVIVTSRTRFTGLFTAGAHLRTLDLLADHEAERVLATRIGPARAAAEPDAVREVVALCAGLPLALALVAARTAALPGVALSDIAAELRRGPDEDLRAVFSWSYRRLSPAAARVFRLMAVHPGPDISAAALGALARNARAAELLRNGLVSEHRPGRYVVHDLLRAYAAELSDEHDSDAERVAARYRLTQSYRHNAYLALQPLLPEIAPPAPPPPPEGVHPGAPADAGAAMRWFAEERHVLRGLITYADAATAWELALSLQTLYHRHGHWHEWAQTMLTALEITRAAHDRLGSAHLHRSLAGAYFNLGRLTDAREHLERAYDYFVALGRSSEVAHVHKNLGPVLLALGDREAADRHLREALALFEQAGEDKPLANVLTLRAEYLSDVGEYGQAIELLHRATDVYARLGDVNGQANCLWVLADVYRAQGRPDQALQSARRSLELFRQAGNRSNVARLLLLVGDSLLAAGDPVRARQAFAEALTWVEDAETPTVQGARSRLRGLTGS